MFIIRATTLTDQVVASFAAAGAVAPKQLLEANQQARQVVEASQHLGPQRDDITVAVTRALQAGTDPAADPEVQRLVTGQTISTNAANGVETIVGGQLIELFRQRAGDCFTAWRKPFETAARKLAEAHAQLDNLDLEDTAAVVSRGGDAAEAWGRAQQASQTISAADEGWIALAQLTRLADVNADYKSLRIADIDPGTWLDAGDLGRLTAWQLQCKGLPLSLATFAEYRQRVGRIDTKRQEREQLRQNEALMRETGKNQRARV